VSKGYADFVILDANKNVVEPNFQLDDTFSSHCKLFEILKRFFDSHSESMLFAAVESTGGYENNWLHSLTGFQGALNIRSTRLNPLGVRANSRASLRRVITDKISARIIRDRAPILSAPLSGRYLPSPRFSWCRACPEEG